MTSGGCGLFPRDKITFDKVLLIEDGDKVTVSAPAIKGAKISAKIESHLKGDKVIVFKKKRRKGKEEKKKKESNNKGKQRAELF